MERRLMDPEIPHNPSSRCTFPPMAVPCVHLQTPSHSLQHNAALLNFAILKTQNEGQGMEGLTAFKMPHTLSTVPSRKRRSVKFPLTGMK
jgi:hypothetical protein